MSGPREHTLDNAPRPRYAREQTVQVTGGHLQTATRGKKREAKPSRRAAMVKVQPHRHSVKEVVATLAYVLSKADRAEDDWAAEVDQSPTKIAKEWGIRDGDGRLAAHLIFSLPNKDPDKEWEAAKEAIRECFPNSPYVCVLHTDTDHPHVHVVLRSRDYTGRKVTHSARDAARVSPGAGQGRAQARHRGRGAALQSADASAGPLAGFFGARADFSAARPAHCRAA